MKKVEQKLIKDLSLWQAGKVSANTDVIKDEVNANMYLVQLHGNTIAAIHRPSTNDDATIELYDAGWQTPTTKSRLNALLQYYAPGNAIIQRQRVWYVRTATGPEHEWMGQAVFKRGQLLHL